MELPSHTPLPEEKPDQETSSGNPQQTSQPDEKAVPWKLVILCVFFVLIFMVMFYPPAQNLLIKTEVYLQSYGWYGNLFLILFVGCIIVPLGFPYSMFQMIFAMMIKNFWLSLTLTTLAQTLGAAISYWLSKGLLKEKLRAWLQSQPLFRGIEVILSRDPIKFSLILNLTNLPLIVKNYALAMPDSIGFNVYIMTAIIGAIFSSAPQIYVFQEADRLKDLINNQQSLQSPVNTAFTVITTILSMVIIIYVIWYTKKLLNEIQQEMKTASKQAASDNNKITIEIVKQVEIVESNTKEGQKEAGKTCRTKEETSIVIHSERVYVVEVEA